MGELTSKKVLQSFELILEDINKFDQNEKISLLNEIKIKLHENSPFKNEPVDCVLWIKSSDIYANDYNPNVVAPPEMELLQHSIREDGYTQPIVSWKTDKGYEVVDGFHRNRVGKECPDIKFRIMDYLPITLINESKKNKSNRIASTIRHNRARGKHKVEGMSEIVLELKNRNWTNERIAKELGMDQDEILRLCQITGLAGLFSDQEFSKSWDIEDSEKNDFIPIDDDFEEIDVRTVNTNDPERIFHTHDKWECFQAGLYATTMPGMTKGECERAYANFLSDSKEFENALRYIINNWKYSCEHYLTNSSMNRIAYLGQAAMCYATGIPAVFRGGFNLLSERQQKEANELALKYLNIWLKNNNRSEISMIEALSTNQMDIY